MKKVVNIPLGSQHISLLEPIRFQFTCENETIVDVGADVGFVHRGVEKACTTKFEYKQVGYVVARICGLCAITHSLSYTLAAEKLLGLETNARIKYLRMLMVELDRIQFDYVAVGGVNRDLTSELAQMVLKHLALLEPKIDDLMELFTRNWSLSLKYKGVGVLSLEAAQTYNALGPLARASGVATDVRAESSDLPYGDVGFEMVLERGGDIHARNLVRLREIYNSMAMCRAIVGNLPQGEILERVKGKPDGETAVRLEAPRGELMYYLRGAKKPMLDRVRIKTPTFSGIPAMIEVFKGSEYADAPAILASFDPCMSCTAK